MNRLLNRLVNLLLLILAVFCLIFLIADSFSCVIDPTLPIWLILACVLLWVAGSFPKGFWIGMPLSAVLLFGAYLFFHTDPVLELSNLLDKVTGAFYTHVANPGAAYPYAAYEGSHTLVLTFLGFLMGAYGIVALTSKNARISLSLLGTIPIVAACLVVNGKVPAIPAAGILLFWFLLTVTGNGFHPDGSAARSFLCCILPVCLLLGGILMLNRPENYVYTEHDLEISRRFDRLNHYFDLLMGGGNAKGAASDPEHPAGTSAPRSHFQVTWDGNDDSMELTEDYDFNNAELPVLRIKAEATGQLYLRTKSFGDYRGTGWYPAEELNSGSSLPFAAFAASASSLGVSRTLEVRTLMDLDELCLPYYAAVSTGSDAFASADGQESYLVSYTEYTGEVSALRLPQNAQTAEASYRAHAHSVYTRLPESTEAAALRICQEAELSAGSSDLIRKVAEFVQKDSEYDLQTGAYPSDDYAIYFLTEAHRGYCIHYATAATVLYRALGIPARVAEGFLAETRAGRSTDVLAGDAHAWVEVYLDGIGWIPVEVTKQAGFATEEPEPTPEPTNEPTDTPEKTAEPSGGGGEKPTPTPEPSPEPSPQGQDIQIKTGPSRSIPWRLLLIPLILLILLPVWYSILRAYWTTQIHSADGHRAAIACWKYASRVAAFGADVPESITQIAEKAAFSPHMIRREEIELCRSELKSMVETLYPTLSSFQKFKFCLLRGLR